MLIVLAFILGLVLSVNGKQQGYYNQQKASRQAGDDISIVFCKEIVIKIIEHKEHSDYIKTGDIVVLSVE